MSDLSIPDEDCCIEMADEPHAVKPKASLISHGTVSAINKENPYKSLTVVRPLNKGKAAVFLVHCKNQRKNYAMKLFKSQQKDARRCFKNEIRFATLSHPNIIRTVHYERNRVLKHKNSTETSALILTEFAPYGDLFDLVTKHPHYITEVLVRTYFKQLIEGLEYLHTRSIAHLDIKLENLLIGEDCVLKIADFDLSCFTNDTKIISRGSKNYRAPEMITGECKDGKAADIYSAGTVLFVLKCKGAVPHTEQQPKDDIDFYNLLNENNTEFWKQHCEMQRVKPSFFSDEFKELVNGMMKVNARERLTLDEIKKSKWYNGPVYTNEELKRHFKGFN